MGISYQGRDVQKQSEVGLRLEDLVSYDYSAYDSGSGEGAVEIVDRWLVADDFQYSSSIEFDKDSFETYSASYFLPTVINISGNFYGPLYGTATSASYALSASYVPSSIDTSSFYVSSPSNILFANTYLLIAKGDGTTDTIDLTSLIPSTASYVLSASYAANGGVTQLLAGPNVTLSPTNGLGQVTVSATLSGSTIFNTATGSYGSFYDTTTQTNPVANVPRSMSFNSTDITNGVSISGSTNPFNTYIKTTNAGVYDIQFSAQVDKTDSGADEIVIWLRKNGIDLTDTATTLTLSGNNDKQVAAWNWFVSSAAGDYYQIIWISADTNIRLLAEPISGTHPGIPSVILTVNRVDQFLSNTGSFNGSFNGSFTGSLFGTASWATNALTASFINTASTNAFVQGGNSFGATALLGTNDNQSLAFRTNGSTKMLISGSGVGIGNIPQSGFSLDANSNIVTRASFYVNNDIYFFGPSNSNIRISGLRFTDLTTSTTQVNISTTGNLGIGIGTTTASSRLQVRGSGATSATTALRVENSSASPSLVVLDNGYVGIGTIAPSTSLHITGSSNSGLLKIDSPAANNILYVSGSGNVGIGTNTPAYPLEVNGAIYQTTGQILITSSGSVGAKEGAFIAANPSARSFQIGISDNSVVPVGIDMFSINNSFPSSYLNFRVNNADLVRMTGSFVGIGTTSPASTLDVSGSGRFTNGLTVTGSQFIFTSGSSVELRVTGTGVDIGNIITDTHTVTGSLKVSGSITSSLFGTASWAQSASQALSASWAPSVASNPFPFTGSALITGSLGITGSASIRGILFQGTSVAATGLFAHAQGFGSTANADYSHAEGFVVTTLGAYSHAEGQGTTTIGAYSHAEGQSTTTYGDNSHAEGEATVAVGIASHAEGRYTSASADYSHAEGVGTIALGLYQHAQGSYNLASSAQSAFIIGNGVDGSNRSNLVFASGSQFQITGSLIATSLTGSLLGTASWAVSASRATSASFALSASWAPGGSSTPTFPYTGSAIISGSLVITGSLRVGVPGVNNPRIDTVVGTLSRGDVVSVDWINKQLQDASTISSLDWESRVLYDTAGGTSIDWENRTLSEGTGTYVALEYSSDTYVNSQLYYRNVIPGQVQRAVADTPAYGGQVIQATVAVGVADYSLVYLETDGTWYNPKATVGYGPDKMLGICVDQASGYVLIEGDIGVSDDNSQGVYISGADHGLPVYISDTTGRMTITAPSSTNNVVRIVGHIYYQSTTDINWWTMKFRPSNDWYII
jgi:hypothetical protein